MSLTFVLYPTHSGEFFSSSHYVTLVELDEVETELELVETELELEELELELDELELEELELVEFAAIKAKLQSSASPILT